MPELPEVETMARDLAPLLIGRTIRGAYLARPKLSPDPGLVAGIEGRRISAVGRRAKSIIIELGDRALLLAPRMSGAPRITTAGAVAEKHDHFGFELGEGRRRTGAFRWRDPRMFGRLRLVYRTPDGYRDGDGRDPFAKTGPEPLEIGVAGILERLTARPRTGIKALLLDQRAIAGIGNIYADEALYRAKTHPATPAGFVPQSKLRALSRAIIAVLEAGIADRGARVRSYAPPAGGAAMQLRLAAYGRAGLSCLRCTTTLVRGVVAGRTTVWCPQCQVDE
jgi:formamidopyrimidine-DNA glycosylase